MIHRAYVDNSEVFSDRPLHLQTLKHGLNKGIVLRNGQPWKAMRKFMSKTLQQLGVSRNSFQECIQVGVAVLASTSEFHQKLFI